MQTATRDPKELRPAIAALAAWGDARGWVGSDPYEGLNARRPRLLTRNPIGRRLLIQFVKRSPLDLRAAVGIEPTANAAAFGQALAGHARLHRAGEGGQEEVTRLVGALAEQRAADYDEPSWSYPFDVESRVFFYPRTTPNTIATAFAALGLLEAHEATGADEPLRLAAGAGEFFLRHVPQTESGEGAFFGYFPGDRTPIHNASLLACGLLARLAGATGRDDFREAAAAGVRYALAHQRPDGSWPYGESPGLGWVDGFHTGYVLDSLQRCMVAVDSPELRESHARGLAFYRDRLLLPDGTPKYFADRVHPIDSQSVAQAISTFAYASRLDSEWLEPACRVFGFAMRRMRRSDGAFLFQRGRFWVNRAAHVRWVQAPMFDAMTLLAESIDGAYAGAR